MGAAMLVEQQLYLVAAGADTDRRGRSRGTRSAARGGLPAACGAGASARLRPPFPGTSSRPEVPPFDRVLYPVSGVTKTRNLGVRLFQVLQTCERHQYSGPRIN